MIQETKLTFCEWLKEVSKPRPTALMSQLISCSIPFTQNTKDEIVQIIGPVKTWCFLDLLTGEYFEIKKNNLKNQTNETNN